MAEPITLDPIQGVIVQKALDVGMNPALALSIATQESALNPQARNPRGEAYGSGLFGFIPSTAQTQGMPWEQRYDPTTSAQYGTQYFRQLLDTSGGDVRAALRKYGGADTGGDPEYDTHVLNHYPQYQHLATLSREQPRGAAQSPTAEESAAPRLAQASSQDISALNRAFLQQGQRASAPSSAAAPDVQTLNQQFVQQGATPPRAGQPEGTVRATIEPETFFAGAQPATTQVTPMLETTAASTARPATGAMPGVELSRLAVPGAPEALGAQAAWLSQAAGGTAPPPPEASLIRPITTSAAPLVQTPPVSVGQMGKEAASLGIRGALVGGASMIPGVGIPAAMLTGLALNRVLPALGLEEPEKPIFNVGGLPIKLGDVAAVASPLVGPAYQGARSLIGKSAAATAITEAEGAMNAAQRVWADDVEKVAVAHATGDAKALADATKAAATAQKTFRARLDDYNTAKAAAEKASQQEYAGTVTRTAAEQKAFEEAQAAHTTATEKAADFERRVQAHAQAVQEGEQIGARFAPPVSSDKLYDIADPALKGATIPLSDLRTDVTGMIQNMKQGEVLPSKVQGFYHEALTQGPDVKAEFVREQMKKLRPLMYDRDGQARLWASRLYGRYGQAFEDAARADPALAGDALTKIQAANAAFRREKATEVVDSWFQPGRSSPVSMTAEGPKLNVPALLNRLEERLRDPLWAGSFSDVERNQLSTMIRDVGKTPSFPSGERPPTPPPLTVQPSEALPGGMSLPELASVSRGRGVPPDPRDPLSGSVPGAIPVTRGPMEMPAEPPPVAPKLGARPPFALPTLGKAARFVGIELPSLYYTPGWGKIAPAAVMAGEAVSAVAPQLDYALSKLWLSPTFRPMVESALRGEPVSPALRAALIGSMAAGTEEEVQRTRTEHPR